MAIEFNRILTMLRKERGITQKQAAQDLGISLDALVFPETAVPNAVPKCVYDFFHGMSANDAQRYIDFCKSIEALTEGKEKRENK